MSTLKKKMPEYAFILAAGKGTRLRPYTDDMPKPMVPVNGTPIISHTIGKLEKSGVKNITINLNYLGDRIENYLAQRPDLYIKFSYEDSLLDTGGGVKKALENMSGNDFFLINGDAFWQDSKVPALERLARHWEPQKMDILLMMQPVDQMLLTTGIGDYDLSKDGKAVRSLDKSGAYMFTGIRLTKSIVFKNTPEGAFSFLTLMDKAQEQGRLYGLVHDNQWHHISTPEDLDRVNADFTANHSKTA